MNRVRTLALRAAIAMAGLMVLNDALAATGPGETSGGPLAPLQVVDVNQATGDMKLSYQSGCGTIDNSVYYGSLTGVSSLQWTGSVCGIGTSGQFTGFNPGPGSYFFVVVGNDGTHEGSYGQSYLTGTTTERSHYGGGGGCGKVQMLTAACSPTPVGSVCTSSAECGMRQTCLENAAGGGAQCACLDPFTGAQCETCAPGYAGLDCRECAEGFVSNAMQNHNGGESPVDVTAPDKFRCVPDVLGDCTGRTCSARGTCTVVGRDALCACDEGYTGENCQECAPNYEVGASGGCMLAQTCREEKCGGHGSCVAAGFGDVMCSCDSGYSGADCGGPALRIVVNSDTFTLYDGESLVLQPQGGRGPYQWRLDEGPAQLVDCDSRNGCTPGGAMLTVTAPGPGGFPELELVKVSLSDGMGNNSSHNFAAIPSTYVPFTGGIKTELLPFYRAMLKYMRARGIRAAVLGISKGGTIVGTNGYGYRDAGFDADPFENAGEGGPNMLVQPNSPFRIASVTKPLTAAAVRGAALDAGVNITNSQPFNQAIRWVGDAINFNFNNGVAPFDYNLQTPGIVDNRWQTISILELLNHHVGFWRDPNLPLPSTTGNPRYDSGFLPLTVDNGNQSGFQSAVIGTDSDISYATMYAVAALQANPPIPTARNMILFTAGNTFQYAPGTNAVNGGDNYANIGYILAGRVLEGLKGFDYDANEPGVPLGWGKFPTLLQDYLCEASGIQTGIFPGDAFHPQPFEPYYRSMSASGVENLSWNLEDPDKVRFDNFAQQWEFCQENCPDGPGDVWDATTNTPRAYGGVWLAQRNSAGGIVATTSALLKFARNHRVKVGTPFEGAGGIGTLLPGVAAHGGGSSHNGSLPGILSWLWQMGGTRMNTIPQDTGAWNPDPNAPLDVDPNGLTVINESTSSFFCDLPDDVAVAVMINQNHDERAPAGTFPGNSNNGNVYGRIFDYLGRAACQVEVQGWPQAAEPNAINNVPICN